MELADVVTRAVEMVSPLIEATEQKLSVNVAATGLLVKGDPVRLSQSVTNLLTNAAKYTPRHGSIDIAAERHGSTVSLSIRDNGIGISREMLPRVFFLFAQERQQLDRARGGLGLGLAIVRSLVEMHGGKVSAHSEGLGKGSEFVLELAQRLLERLAPRRLALIALTGYGQDRDRHRARESGFDFHLVKPVDANHLQDAIWQVSRKGAEFPSTTGPSTVG